MSLQIIPNVFTTVFNNVKYDFTPTKPKNSSDIAFDVRARLTRIIQGDSEMWQHTDSIVIYPDAIAKIPLGFSLTMPESFTILNDKAFEGFENFVQDLIDYNLNSHSNDEPSLKDFITDDMRQTFYPSSQLLGRSGMFFKSALATFNGQIDNTYDDELVIALHNIGNKPQEIKFGERIGQLEIKLVPEVLMNPNYVNDVNLLNGGKRGGFGSSGRH